MTKWVYQFGGIHTEGNAGLKNLLGSKGANLAEIAQMKLPIPPGFTITTAGNLEYLNQNKKIPAGIKTQVIEALKNLNFNLNLEFGNSYNPLLLAIRSGSAVSMPGMMDTILNVGLNDLTVQGLASHSQNEWFAYDCYRRLIEMYGDIVLKIERKNFDEIRNIYLNTSVSTYENNLNTDNLKILIEKYKVLINRHNKIFPQDPYEQLWESIAAIFKSWMNERAIKYRKINNVDNIGGTAVTVQSMVFGNFGNTSASGVCFTRNPSTGENKFYGEYLLNCQGEDVVAGIHTPIQINKEDNNFNTSNNISLEELLPAAYAELKAASSILEKHFLDMQDIEFTIQNKKLWLLQTRNGKRSARAAVKIAVDMANDGLITRNEAIMQINAKNIDNLLHPAIDASETSYKVVSSGLPASPGTATGHVCFNTPDAELLYKKHKIILVRSETSPDDIGGINVSQGIITGRGGMTSHAAVVARGMGKPCIVGASGLIINEQMKVITIGNVIIKEGDEISINGTTGEIILGQVKTIMPEIFPELQQLLRWCNEIKTLKIRANADTHEDVLTALKFGAEGIGLCRTEHMFFEHSRLFSVRKMIISTNTIDTQKAIDELFIYQKDDFKVLFNAMQGKPVTIRLLDPPLHEFLPTNDTDFQDLSVALNVDFNAIKSRVSSLKEHNPMLGHRGCRLAISNPEIYQMQVKAILEASLDVSFQGDIEIMIPLVLNSAELKYCKKLIEEVANQLTISGSSKLNYQIGTMIELPRAALAAKELAKDATFFSFGTNDLTQTTMGISRDDSSTFMQFYLDKKIFSDDPFATIDIKGVGEMVKIACKRGRKSNPNIKLGVCGEHGGDPKSIEFFSSLNMDYVSCSPYRIPIARLAAAQAAIRKNMVIK